MPAKPIPDGYHSITPFMTVRDAARAIDFYKQAFGAKERGVMKIGIVGRAAAGLTLMTALPGVAFAQAATEIIGQPIQVTTNGVTNVLASPDSQDNVGSDEGFASSRIIRLGLRIKF